MSSFITTSKSTVSITKIYNELKYNSQNLFKKANNGLVSDFLNQSCKFIPSPTNIKQRESSVD